VYNLAFIRNENNKFSFYTPGHYDDLQTIEKLDKLFILREKTGSILFAAQSNNRGDQIIFLKMWDKEMYQVLQNFKKRK